jgi:6-phosphogluconolactonase (cycloisomerase 2 family)
MLMSRRLWAGCAVLGTALLLSCGSGDKKGVVYLVGQSDQSVGAYQLNLRTGILFTDNNALAWIGNKAKTGIQPNVMIFNPGQTTAFISDGGSSDIASFSVNHDGSLAAGTVIQLKKPASNPVALAMDPGGKFLFVADQGVPDDPNCGAKGTNPAECQAGISVFSVSGGALTEVPGSPFPLLTQQQTTTFPAPVIPAGVSVANAGNFLYATDQANNIVLGFAFDGTTGALTALTSTTPPALWPVIVGSAPSGVFSPPIGNFLYVTNTISNNIYEYKINQSDGSLTLVVGSPVTAGVGPTVMLSDPKATYLFAVGTGSNQLLGFRINQVTGALTALNPASVSTGASPVAATIRSNDVLNGDYWIVVSNNGANSVTTVDFINSTGAMSILPTLIGPTAPFGVASR